MLQESVEQHSDQEKVAASDDAGCWITCAAAKDVWLEELGRLDRNAAF